MVDFKDTVCEQVNLKNMKKMKTIKIKVLSRDIKSTSYTSSHDCALTRAFKRAGIEAEHNGTDMIRDFVLFGENRIIELSKDVNDTVLRMYAHVSGDPWKRLTNGKLAWGEATGKLGTLKPKNFEFTVKI